MFTEIRLPPDPPMWTSFEGPSGRVFIEHPAPLTDAQRSALQRAIAAADGRPVLLDAGARVRSVDAWGTVTPEDGSPITVVLPWWAFALGSVVGAAAALLVGAIS